MSDRERGPLDFDDEREPTGPPREPEPEPKPEEEVPPPAAPARTSRFGWVVGIIFVAWIVYITINTLRTDSPGSRGVPDGHPLPPFAMPLALSDLEGDSNIATRRNQGGAGKLPACSVRGPRILNSCQLAERGPVALAFYASRAGKACRTQLDVVERVRRDFPGVQFAAVAIRGNRGDLKSLIRESGLRYPVGYDHDGQVANLYRVAGCPTMTFAYPGGIVMHTYLGLLDEERLSGVVRRLVAGSERRGWKPPAT
jgi:AhpC/TSA family